MLPAVSPAPALSLFDAGYRDLIPIVPPNASLSPSTKLRPEQRGKVPGHVGADGLWAGLKDWQHLSASRGDVERWHSSGASFGLRTSAFPTIDVDVTDSTLAELVDRAITAVLGTNLRRVGRAPKFAVPCRAELPFTKMKLSLQGAGGESLGIIEILAEGQQFVVEGIHPGTGQAYVWSNGGRSGGAEILAEASPADLPLLTPEVVTGELLRELQGVLATAGVSVGLSGDGRKRATAVLQEALLAPSIGVLREAVGLIPNDESWDHRDDYVTMGIAIKGAAGPDHEAEGLELYLEWASRWTDGWNDPDVVRGDWQRMKPPFQLGWDWIAAHAREHGLNDASLDFGDLPQGNSLDPGERVAAICGDPMRAFFLDAAEAPDASLAQRWMAMQTATAKGDPLKTVFSTVLNAGAALQRFASEPTRFAAFLEARLRADPIWKSLSTTDRGLLIRACYALLADLPTLERGLGYSAGLALPLATLSREELVEGWIPSKGVAALVGAPGQGKSFIAVELAARVASQPASGISGVGEPQAFAKRGVQHGTVLYFTSEDIQGLQGRLERWIARNGPLQHFRLFGRVPPLSDPSRAVPFVLEAISSSVPEGAPAVRLLVVDVMRAALAGNENDSEVMGSAMATANLLARMTGAAVLLIHHTRKDSPEVARGSGAFTAALDFEAAVKAAESGFTLTVTKNKHAPGGDSFTWHLRDGVLAEGASPSSAANAKPLEQLVELSARELLEIADEKQGATRQQLAHAMVAAAPALLAPPEKRSTSQTRITKAIRRAIERGWVTTKGQGRFERFFPGVIPPSIALGACSLDDLL